MPNKSPNFTRYERVARIVLADAALRKKLSGATQAICRPPSNVSKEFPLEVIQITDTIHRNGEDAQSFGRNQILMLAGQMLVTKELKPSPLFPFAAEEPSKAKAKVQAEPKRKRGRKRADKREPLPAPDLTAVAPTPEPPASVPNPAPNPVAPSVAAPVPPPASFCTRELTGSELEQHVMVRYLPMPTPPQQSVKGGMIFPVGCAAATNMICASQLLTLHGGPSMKKVVEQLDALIAEVQRNTTIPANYAETAKVEQSAG